MAHPTLPEDLIGSTPRVITDKQALDMLAVYMGANASWNGGDVCEIAADVLSKTGRPHPGESNNRAMYRQFADRFDVMHDGEDEYVYSPEAAERMAYLLANGD